MKRKRLTGKERLDKYPYGGEGGGGGKRNSNKSTIPKSRPTTQDSLNLYNNALQVLDYYKKRGYSSEERLDQGDDVVGKLDQYAKEYDPNKKRYVVSKGKSAELPVPKNIYRRDLNDNQFYQREYIDNILDTRSPMQMFDRRIRPTKNTMFINNNPNDPLFGDRVGVYAYDPEKIKPAFLRGNRNNVATGTAKPNITKPAIVPPELNPVDIQGIIPVSTPNVQASIKPITMSNKSKYSATYRSPNKDSRQQTIYFKNKQEWQDFLGTGALSNVDTSETQDSASATGYRSLYAGGGEVPAMPNTGGAGWGAAGQLLPVIGDAIISLLDKPGYTNQPIMNAQTAKNMTSPYAFGGELDDIDNEQFIMYLKAMFDNQMTAENTDDADYEVLEEGIDEDMEEDSFAMGGKVKKKGIYIKPSKKGTFTTAAKKRGKSVQTFASQVLANKGNYSSAMVKKANFARNASKWKKAMGGDTYAQGGLTNIEVEGDEILQTPNGEMQKMKGPSHEQGGIDVTVPDGTKIYSDRLTIEGKTMQQRKLSREKRLAKAQEVFSKNPSSVIARNTIERTQQVVGREEEQDMTLQKIANKIYSPPQQAAYGDEVGDPWSDYIYSQLPGYGTKIPFRPGAEISMIPGSGRPLSTSATGRGINVDIPVANRTADDIGLANPSTNTAFNIPDIPDTSTYSNPTGLTTGDYIGLGANLFNAIAPIINTQNARKATRPEVNRFQSFGKQALEANAKAQGFAGVQASNAKRQLDTSTGSAILRNRLGARSINTVRALDTVADINRNKGISDIYSGYTNQMSNLLGQEAQLANQRDQVVMSGATARDEREAQNIDNYYSNMAENLTNLGTNVGNIGRSLNQSKGNRDNVALLEAMSEYFDFGRDKNGKLVLKNKSR